VDTTVAASDYPPVAMLHEGCACVCGPNRPDDSQAWIEEVQFRRMPLRLSLHVAQGKAIGIEQEFVHAWKFALLPANLKRGRVHIREDAALRGRSQ
jgi:hypothetical protein